MLRHINVASHRYGKLNILTYMEYEEDQNGKLVMIVNDRVFESYPLYPQAFELLWILMRQGDMSQREAVDFMQNHLSGIGIMAQHLLVSHVPGVSLFEKVKRTFYKEETI